jgi:hypothetical protein
MLEGRRDQTAQLQALWSGMTHPRIKAQYAMVTQLYADLNIPPPPPIEHLEQRSKQQLITHMVDIYAIPADLISGPRDEIEAFLTQPQVP